MRTYPDRGLHGRAVQELGLRVVRGDLAPGAIVDMDELGAKFDVSRTVIREALKVLAGKGLVDARPKRGTFVRERNDWNLLDPDVLRWQFEAPTDMTIWDRLAEVRMIVEPAAAALAALRRTEADLGRLRTAYQEMVRTADGDLALAIEADLAFHRALLKSTGNELLEQMAMVVEIGLHARDRYVHGNWASFDQSLPAHGKVLKAIEVGDSSLASKLMAALLEAAAQDVRVIQEREQSAAQHTPA